MAKSLQEVLADLAPEQQGRVLGTLQAGEALNKLLADAELAREVLPLLDKAAKKVNPAHQTIEEQAAPIVERALAKVDEKLAARDKAAEQKSVETSLEAKMKAAYDEGFTEDGVKGVLEIMKRGVADFDDAKKIYRADHPTPSSSPTQDSRMNWDFYSEIASDDLKGFFDGSAAKTRSITDNPQAWERETALGYLSGRIPLPAA